MKNSLTSILIVCFIFAQSSICGVRPKTNGHQSDARFAASDQIEPNAGNWRTWRISSGRDYRVSPPPNPAETQAELRSLSDLISQNDGQVRQQITFWDAGAPAYRWIDLINS